MTESPPRKVTELSDSTGVEEAGPWPFVTRRVYRSADQPTRIWSSRHHRKGLRVRTAAEAEGGVEQWLQCLWMPGQLNWWIGIIFALGSLLFAVASVLSLAPGLAQVLSLDSTGTNAVFFAGSIPFTIAAYLQLYQAANADRGKGSALTPFPSLFGCAPMTSVG